MARFWVSWPYVFSHHNLALQNTGQRSGGGGGGHALNSQIAHTQRAQKCKLCDRKSTPQWALVYNMRSETGKQCIASFKLSWECGHRVTQLWGHPWRVCRWPVSAQGALIWASWLNIQSKQTHRYGDFASHEGQQYVSPHTSHPIHAPQT